MVPVLTSLPVILRPPRNGDAEDRFRIGLVPEFILMCGGDPKPAATYTEADARTWYEHRMADSCGWCIEVSGRCIGHARLHSLDTENRRARYAIGIFDPSAWGLGYGTLATRLVIGYAFEVLHLHRVDLRVLAYNARAIACYRRCGFIQEGIERDAALIGGHWYDDVIMSMLEAEYRAAELDLDESDGALAGHKPDTYQ